MKSGAFLAALLAGALFCAGANAAPVTFTDRSAFNTALPSGATILEETFNTVTADAAILNFASGLTSTATPFNPPANQFEIVHRTRFGFFQPGIDFENVGNDDGPTAVTWTFSTEIFAIGFDFFAVNPENSAGAHVTVNDLSGAVTFLLLDLATTIDFIGEGNGFAGFISESAISSIVFTGSPFVNGRDVFSIDNAVFVSKVPVPAALPLLVSALAGIALLGRRTRRYRATA